MAFGERLQLLRRRSGLTQEQFAEQLQVSRQAVSKWESGKGYPEMEKLLFICRQYGVTLNDLFEQGENEPISREISPAIPLKVSVAAFVSNYSVACSLAEQISRICTHNGSIHSVFTGR